MIGIINYEAGNLKSIHKAFRYLGFECRILAKPNRMSEIERLVLPGVGAFGHAADVLAAGGWKEPVLEWIKQDRPFLGICLGMQLLFDSSDESPQARGLGVFAGICRRFEQGKVPQIGWNQIDLDSKHPLFRGIPNKEFFYFIHGYYVFPNSPWVTLARTFYFLDYVSVVGRGRIYGVQFHPEKSGDAGLKLLNNWVSLC